MANEINLHVAKENVRELLDQFEGETLVNLNDYIVGEDTIQNLRRAINRLEKMMGRITNRATYEAAPGDIDPAALAEFTLRKTEILQTIDTFKTQTLPDLCNHMKNDPDVLRLSESVDRLYDMYNLTNPAEFWA